MGEDFRFRNRQGDELPAWVANKAERMKKIKEAKAALEKTPHQGSSVIIQGPSPRSGF
jgi:hypothetical protein